MASIYSENSFAHTQKWGYNIFGLVTTGSWGETYAGIWYKPFSRTQIGLYGGIETGGSNLRAAASCIQFADTARGFWRRLLIKGFYEQGGGKDNSWYHLSVQYQTARWRLGGISRRFYGTGPWIQYQMKRPAILVGAAYLYDAEAKEIKPTAFVGWNF